MDGQVGSGNYLRLCAFGGCRFVLEKGTGKCMHYLVISYRTRLVRELKASRRRLKNAESRCWVMAQEAMQ